MGPHKREQGGEALIVREGESLAQSTGTRDNVKMRPKWGRMRLSSALFTMVILTFGFAGVATAQKESAGQPFDIRKMTDSESTPPPPASERRAGDAQENAGCPGAVELGSVPPAGEPPTDEDLLISHIPITGESFRLTYETSDADESGLPFFDVTVLDEAGKEVGGRVIFEEGTEQETVRAGPGRFDIETTAEDLKYRITVEDCTGSDNPPSGGSGGGGQPASDDQYSNDVDNPDEVIDDTISNEPLPNTGGVPLLGLGFFTFFCVFAAIALLRPVIRRDH